MKNVMIHVSVEANAEPSLFSLPLFPSPPEFTQSSSMVRMMNHISLTCGFDTDILNNYSTCYCSLSIISM